MKLALLLIVALTQLSGCGAHYRVKVVNATTEPLNVAIIEEWAGGGPSDDLPAATVAPGGSFVDRVRDGRRCERRFVRVQGSSGPGLEIAVPDGGRVERTITKMDGRLEAGLLRLK